MPKERCEGWKEGREWFPLDTGGKVAVQATAGIHRDVLLGKIGVTRKMWRYQSSGSPRRDDFHCNVLTMTTMTMTMTLRKVQTSVDGGLALQARVLGS